MSVNELISRRARSGRRGDSLGSAREYIALLNGILTRRRAQGDVPEPPAQRSDSELDDDGDDDDSDGSGSGDGSGNRASTDGDTDDKSMDG